MNRLIICLLLIGLPSVAFADYVYCGGRVQRVQIENGSYMVWLGESIPSSSIHELGPLLNPKADKYFSMALTAYATQDVFNIRYTNSPSPSCSNLRSASSSISYVTFFK